MKHTTNVDRILAITDIDKTKRIEKIISQLTVPYRIQKTQDRWSSADITNIIVPARKQYGKLVLTAHHDVFPGSIGYNDNSTGVVTLLKLQDDLPDDVELVFTDHEERSGMGCTAYLAQERDEETLPRMAINVDVVGLGQKVFGVKYGFTDKIDLSDTDIDFLDSVPFNDSCILENFNVPNIFVFTGTQKRNIVNEIFSAQHNNHNDGKLELISEVAMDNVFNVLTTLIKNNSYSKRRTKLLKEKVRG